MKKAGIFLISLLLLKLAVIRAPVFAQEGPSKIDHLQEDVLKEERALAERAVTPEARPAVNYNSAGLRDPFDNPVTPGLSAGKDAYTSSQTPLPQLTVQGIVWGGAFPQAIINNQVVKAGDMLGGARIIDIGKDGVTVFFGGKQFKLSSPASGGGAP